MDLRRRGILNEARPVGGDLVSTTTTFAKEQGLKRVVGAKVETIHGGLALLEVGLESC